MGGGPASAINSGVNSGAIFAETEIDGAATAINSGVNNGEVSAVANVGGAATAINSGVNNGGVFAETNRGGAIVINSGVINGVVSARTFTGSATVINSGVINNYGGLAISLDGASRTLTNILGGRVIGAIDGSPDIINFRGGNWVFTFDSLSGATIDAGGAPFVKSGNQVAVLDPTSFALADRGLVNFTGGISRLLAGRFASMGWSGDAVALGSAPSGSSPAASLFGDLSGVAMAYASAPPAAGQPLQPIVYDTTVWSGGFVAGRVQEANGGLLSATDVGYGGALGVERAVAPGLRLGGFVGGGASREAEDLAVQTIDTTSLFGGVYGRVEWERPYLDFALSGGGLSNASSRQVANNTVASGVETATANYGGWFVSPELTYGYRIPWNGGVITPRASLRYVGGELDGYSETGSAQNLSVGARAVNDLEERLDVELSQAFPMPFGGTVRTVVNAGVVGLERIGGGLVDAVALGQNVSFATPGQKTAAGPLVGASLEYRPRPNMAFFAASEGSLMSDRAFDIGGQGGFRMSF